MNASMRVDMSEFTRTLNKLAATSRQTLPEFLNSEMLDLIKEARDKTPIADRAKIQSDLGAALRSEKIDAKGKLRRRYKYSPTPLAYAIIEMRRKKSGAAMLPKAEVAKAARKLIASRLRAIGSLRAGWSRAIARLASVVRQPSGGSDGPRVRMGSDARVAMDGFSPTSEVSYRVTISRAGERQIDPRVEAALSQGFARKHSEMIARLQREMNEAARQSGAR